MYNKRFVYTILKHYSALQHKFKHDSLHNKIDIYHGFCLFPFISSDCILEYKYFLLPTFNTLHYTEKLNVIHSMLKFYIFTKTHLKSYLKH